MKYFVIMSTVASICRNFYGKVAETAIPDWFKYGTPFLKSSKPLNVRYFGSFSQPLMRHARIFLLSRIRFAPMDSILFTSKYPPPIIEPPPSRPFHNFIRLISWFPLLLLQFKNKNCHRLQWAFLSNNCVGLEPGNGRPYLTMRNLFLLHLTAKRWKIKCSHLVGGKNASFSHLGDWLH